MNLSPLRILLIMGVCLGVLAACGQKGPLFLPGKPTAIPAQKPGTPAKPGTDSAAPAASAPGASSPK